MCLNKLKERQEEKERKQRKEKTREDNTRKENKRIEKKRQEILFKMDDIARRIGVAGLFTGELSDYITDTPD